MYEQIPDNPYLLLTPGPLSTSKGVRNALLRDWCTWDDDYNLGTVQKIRDELVRLSTSQPKNYTSVLIQGSGTFGIEACLGTAIPRDGKLLIVANGAYGMRMARIMQVMGRGSTLLSCEETQQPSLSAIENVLRSDADITHIAMVHCETTTGILNPVGDVARIAKRYGKIVIIDAMSSFGGVPLDMSEMEIDYLVSSANKCIQGVPGFSFVIAKRDLLENCAGNAHSLSLDIYDQWKTMDAGGKWRFTSPTHVVRAFQQALCELESEGGITKRHARYHENQRILSEGMSLLGYRPLLEKSVQSPIITSFLYPFSGFDFKTFYTLMKEKGYVLYPGKISAADTFRIGNIGDVHPRDIRNLLSAVAEVTLILQNASHSQLKGA